MSTHGTKTTTRRNGFSLVELLVSMTVLGVIMLMSAQIIEQMQRTWKAGSSKLEQFREAREAFETITQSLRQATLNTYMTYDYNDGDTPTVPASKDEAPRKYIRHSELQFVSGRADHLLKGEAPELKNTHAVFFQAALGTSSRDGYEGLRRLLCGRGYFIRYSSDVAYRPKHVQTERTRFRLWEYRPAAELNEVYSVTPGEWFANAADETIKPEETADKPSLSRPVAENIIGLFVSPQITAEDAKEQNRDLAWIAPEFDYDSTKIIGRSSTNAQGTQHLLPPVVSVTLVAIDEASAQRLARENPQGVPELIPTGSFAETANFSRDLAALEASLVARKLNYRIFTAAVPMRNSKWNQLFK
jgi:uncharacterized protein (TIGR02599 family)